MGMTALSVVGCSSIDLSLDKYCSVSNMVNQTATISYAFTVNGTRYEQDE